MLTILTILAQSDDGAAAGGGSAVDHRTLDWHRGYRRNVEGLYQGRQARLGSDHSDLQH